MRRAFVVAAVAWAIALPLAAFAASQPHASTASYAFAVAMYQFGAVVCHQLAARSFSLWNVKMPVCARCTGIYVGAALTAVASMAGTSPLRDSAARRLLVAAAIPTAATLVYEWTTGDMPANWIRAVAGFPIGAAIALVVARVR